MLAYITGLQMLHGIGLDSETRHHLDPDNNDEYLGDIQDWFPPNTSLVNPEDDLGQAIDLFAMEALNTPINEGNMFDMLYPDIDDDNEIIGTNPVVVRYGNTPVETTPVTDTTKEDSTMSQPEPKTNPNHRPVITQNEEGTQVHVNVDQLSSDTQARLSYRQVFDLAREMAATTLTHQDQARAQIARFHVQNMRNKGRTWIKASSWNAAINDETKIAQVEKKLHAKFVRELAKKARRNPTIYKVTWNQLIEAIRNPDNADPKLKKILSRTTVGRDVVVNKAQFDQIISLAA